MKTLKIILISVSVVLVLVVLNTVFASYFPWNTAHNQTRLKIISEYSKEVNPKDVTAKVCKEFGCRGALKTDVGYFLSFDRTGKAEYWETVLGGHDARRNGTVVLNMRNMRLTLEQRQYAIDILYSDRDWY